MDSRIVQYYRLNALRNVGNRPLPLIDFVERKAVNVVFGKKQIELMYDSRGGKYYVREDVVGGGKAKPGPILVL